MPRTTQWNEAKGCFETVEDPDATCEAVAESDAAIETSCDLVLSDGDEDEDNEGVVTLC